VLLGPNEIMRVAGRASITIVPVASTMFVGWAASEILLLLQAINSNAISGKREIFGKTSIDCSSLELFLCS